MTTYEWQPIETAPKDGKDWIIGFDGEYVYPIHWVSERGFTGWAYGDFEFGGTLYEGFNEVQRQPTHWMPLPEPPEAK